MATQDPDPAEFLFISREQRMIDQAKPYDGKTACWIPDPDEVYVLGKIIEEKGENIVVEIESKGFEKVCTLYYTYSTFAHKKMLQTGREYHVVDLSAIESHISMGIYTDKIFYFSAP